MKNFSLFWIFAGLQVLVEPKERFMKKFIIYIPLLIGVGFGAFFFGKNKGEESQIITRTRTSYGASHTRSRSQYLGDFQCSLLLHGASVQDQP